MRVIHGGRRIQVVVFRSVSGPYNDLQTGHVAKQVTQVHGRRHFGLQVFRFIGLFVLVLPYVWSINYRLVDKCFDRIGLVAS